ncbi:hypothetical protein D6T64_01265 [Cryobacterium melibiosiphilum]|uniref:Uncharacterized protein n=1 Tax=Cryobacterium melibiosiphilum TaxID=995039 RepID=A0A3A5MRJ5_9MICO|nr:hypothetical protein D6T64_01265 [Cryobacterium melibiosiphilum]
MSEHDMSARCLYVHNFKSRTTFLDVAQHLLGRPFVATAITNTPFMIRQTTDLEISRCTRFMTLIRH